MSLSPLLNFSGLVAASERNFVKGSIELSSCHKTFLDEHKRAKAKSCEGKRCDADYGHMSTMTTCIHNSSRPGVPYTPGIYVYNTVFVKSSYFQNEYSSFKQRLQNFVERKKLLDSIKEKNKLKEVL